MFLRGSRGGSPFKGVHTGTAVVGLALLGLGVWELRGSGFYRALGFRALGLGFKV